MPSLRSYHLLGEIVMEIATAGAWFVLVGWALLQLIQFTTFMGLKIMVEGIIFGILLWIIIPVISTIINVWSV
jgi:hypothetical protein